jgi:hypothetical protein
MSHRDRFEDRRHGQHDWPDGRDHERDVQRNPLEGRRSPDSDRDHWSMRDQRDMDHQHGDPRSLRDYDEGVGRGSYGWGGYGPRPGHATDSARFGGPTYADHRDDHLAQRSRWRDEQRYETPRPEHAPQESRYAAGGRPPQDQDHDHEPHYRQWREQQLSNHDHDYRRWREQQARTYDTEYQNWRRQRHDAFASDFHSWRASQTGLPDAGGSTTSPPAEAVTKTATEEVQSVADGHSRTHRSDDSGDDRRH